MRSELAKLTLGGPAPETSVAAHRAILERLQGEVERLERELSDRYVELRVGRKPVELESVQAALPPNSALVEYAVYTPYDATAKLEYRWGEPRYVAYILPSDGKLSYVYLGEEKLIDQVVGEYRMSLVERTSWRWRDGSMSG